VIQPGLDSIEAGFYLLDLVAKVRNVIEVCGSIFTSLLCNTNLPGCRVPPRLQFLGAGLKILALRFQLAELRFGERVSTGSEQPGDLLKLRSS
jgi:hypothetical protein